MVNQTSREETSEADIETAIKNEKQYKKYENKILVDVLAKLYIIGYSKS